MEIATGGKKFEEYGVNIQDANGKTKELETIFYETIDALKGMDNDTLKASASMDLIGFH